MEFPEVFIFCYYDDNSNPKAVIAEISKFDDFTRDQMDKILSVGEIVEHITEKIDHHYNDEGMLTSWSNKSLGYRALNTETIINDWDTSICFSTWESYADHFHHSFFSKKDIPEWMKFSSEYYINDGNSNLSPIKLHEKLKTLTSNPKIPEHKFIVKYCVLLSEISLNVEDDDTIKPLRFFIKLKDDTSDISDVETKIMQYFDAKSVILSPAYYGFLTPKTIDDWEDLKDGAFDLDIGAIIFA